MLGGIAGTSKGNAGGTLQDFWKAFRREPDGAWTCIAPATLNGPGGRRIQVAPGSRFVRGTIFMGIDLAEWLEANAKREKPVD